MNLPVNVRVKHYPNLGEEISRAIYIQPIAAGVTQGSVIGPLFFLVYIIDLLQGLTPDVKFFANDTSLFSVASASTLNHYMLLVI